MFLNELALWKKITFKAIKTPKKENSINLQCNWSPNQVMAEGNADFSDRIQFL